MTDEDFIKNYVENRKGKILRSEAVDCNDPLFDINDCEDCPNTCVRQDMYEYCICPMECNNFRQVMDISGQFRFF